MLMVCSGCSGQTEWHCLWQVSIGTLRSRLDRALQGSARNTRSSQSIVIARVEQRAAVSCLARYQGNLPVQSCSCDASEQLLDSRAAFAAARERLSWQHEELVYFDTAMQAIGMAVAGVLAVASARRVLLTAARRPMAGSQPRAGTSTLHATNVISSLDVRLEQLRARPNASRARERATLPRLALTLQSSHALRKQRLGSASR